MLSLHKASFLLALISLAPACSMSNRIDERVLECGEEARGHMLPYIHLLNPDGSSLNSSFGFHLQSASGGGTRSTLSSRGCVLIASGDTQTLSVYSSIEGRNLGTLLTDFTATHDQKLSDVSRNDLIFTCDKPLFTHDSFRIPSSRRGDLSGFVVDARLNTASSSVQIFHQMLISEGMPRIDLPTLLPDGPFDFVVSVRNLFQPDAPEKIFTCPITVDRVLPTLSLKSHNRAVELSNLEFSPGQTLQLMNQDQYPENLRYCIEAHAEDRCHMEGNFTEVGPVETLFAPNSGSWRLYVQAKDSASNLSPVQVLPFQVIDRSALEAILAQMKEAKALILKEPVKSLHSVMSALEKYLALGFEVEREMIAGEVITLLNQFTKDSHHQARIEAANFEVFENENGLFAMVVDRNGEVSLLDAKGNFVHTFDTDQDRIYFQVSPRGHWLTIDDSEGHCDFYKVTGKLIRFAFATNHSGVCNFIWANDESSLHYLTDGPTLYVPNDQGLQKIKMHESLDVATARHQLSADGKFLAATGENNQIYLFERKNDELFLAGEWPVANFQSFTFGGGDADQYSIFVLEKDGIIIKLSKDNPPLTLTLHAPFAHETTQTLFTLSSATSLETSAIKSSPTGDLWIDTSTGFWLVSPKAIPFACELNVPSSFVYSSNSIWQLANKGTQILVEGPSDKPAYALDVSGGCDGDLRGFPIESSDSLHTLYGSKVGSEFFMKSGNYLTILNSSGAVPSSFSESSLDRLDVWQGATDTIFVGRNYHGVFARTKSGLRLWDYHNNPAEVGAHDYELLFGSDRVAIISKDGGLDLLDIHGKKVSQFPALSSDTGLVESDHFVLGSGWNEETSELFILTHVDWVRLRIKDDKVTLLAREPHGLDLFSPDLKKFKLKGQNVILLTDEADNRHLVDSTGKAVSADVLALLGQPYNYVINRLNQPLGRIGWTVGEFQLFDEDALSPIKMEGLEPSSFIKSNKNSSYLITGDALGEMQFWSRDEQNKIKNLAFEKTWSWDDDMYREDDFTFDSKDRYLFVNDKSKTKIIDLKTQRLLDNTWDHASKAENDIGFTWTDNDWGEVVTTYTDGYRHFLTDIDALKRELCRFQSPQRRLNAAGFTPETKDVPEKLCD